MNTPLYLADLLTFVAAWTTLLAALYWYRSSQVPVPDYDEEESHQPHNIRALRKLILDAGRYNKRAALAASLAAVCTCASILIRLFLSH